MVWCVRVPTLGCLPLPQRFFKSCILSLTPEAAPEPLTPPSPPKKLLPKPTFLNLYFFPCFPFTPSLRVWSLLVCPPDSDFLECGNRPHQKRTPQKGGRGLLGAVGEELNLQSVGGGVGRGGGLEHSLVIIFLSDTQRKGIKENP